MKITAAAIKEALAQELKTDALRIVGNEALTASKVKPLGSNPREKDVLFVATHGTLSGSSWPSGSRLNNSNGLNGSASSKPCVLVCDDAGVSAQDLLAAANNALISLYAWDAALSACVMDEQPLTELFRIASQLIPYPFVLFGADLSVIATSPHKKGDDFNLAESKRLADDSIEELVMDSEYQDAAKYVDPFYFTGARQVNFYCMNFFQNNEYAARIIFNLGKNTLINAGQEFIIGRFLHACSRALDRLKLTPGGSKNKDLMVLLIRNAVDDTNGTGTDRGMGTGAGPSGGNNEAANALFSYGWHETDSFQLVRIAFHQGTYWQNDADHLCQTLEHNPLASLATSINGEVLWLVDLSASLTNGMHSAAALKALENAAIAGFCGKYAGRAGESLPFCGFDLLKEGYREAGAALSMGYRKNPELWHYRFEDCIMPYILEKATEEISAESLCHPALALLRTHDAAHGTHLAITLVAYARCGQNVSKTADELSVHRTSLQRRLERIKELTGLDFSKHEDITHILVSALMLGM